MCFNSVQNSSEIDDDLATFSPCNFMGGARLTDSSQGAWWTQLHQTWRRHTAIMNTQEICFTVRISCYFFKRSGWNLSDVKNDAKFRICRPCDVWKLGQGWVISLYQLLKLHLRPNLRNTFDGNPLRGCWARCNDKKEKKRKKERKFMDKT